MLRHIFLLIYLSDESSGDDGVVDLMDDVTLSLREGADPDELFGAVADE